MALAEPLGGGLFTTNIVFGLVVLVASRAANVSREAAVRRCCVTQFDRLAELACAACTACILAFCDEHTTYQRRGHGCACICVLHCRLQSRHDLLEVLDSLFV
jgi:hypothetical protein